MKMDGVGLKRWVSTVSDDQVENDQLKVNVTVVGNEIKTSVANIHASWNFTASNKNWFRTL